MIYPYMVYRVKNGEEEYWVAKSSCLKGCIGQGETPNDAEAELEKNEFEGISLNQYISDAVSNYNAFMLKYGEK